MLLRSDGSRFGWLVSQPDEQVTIKPEAPAGLTLATLPDGGSQPQLQDSGAVTLPPFGVGVFRLKGHAVGTVMNP